MSECRICTDTSNTEENPLISPCMCVGSIAKVHQACIERWVTVSRNTKCNVCDSPLAQEVTYNGPMPAGLIRHFLLRERLVSSILRITLLFVTSLIVMNSAFGMWWWYFIDSKFTFHKYALYQLMSYGTFMSIGMVVGFFQQAGNVRINGLDLVVDGKTLALGISRVLAVIEFIVANHHLTFTGRIFPVLIFYYGSVSKLGSIIFRDLLEWYKNHYFVRRFVNRN